ncbi:HDOD domain-containing protein [Deefgea sp. CFH1-16]|uniref:HDOD domain-containing protein n=1 Tax=Deefgea sp. CFH1-16 TaxID=2675457 RepID=UPI0015F69697|nr:HDOD domain-containing protein [Deefgea sp. CFH1-16]MBM5574777.1 HDOD domain-containing protein [Deefgea sp. CFH1-16]
MIFFELVWDTQQNWIGLFAHHAQHDADALSEVCHTYELLSLPCMLLDETATPLASPLMALIRDEQGIALPQGGHLHFKVQHTADLSHLSHHDAACGSWFTEASNSSSNSNPSRPVLLEVLSLIVSDAEIAQLETALAKAPQLMLNLLRLVNSVGMGSATPARSIRQAITLLGRRQLQRWLQLLIYAEQYGDSGKPALLIAAALRGKRMAQWAEQGWLGNTQADEAFLCGMLSLLDRLFGEPLQQLLAPLPLDEHLRSALISGDGILGAALVQLTALEAGDAEHPLITPLLAKQKTWINSEIQAIAWVHRLVRESL